MTRPELRLIGGTEVDLDEGQPKVLLERRTVLGLIVGLPGMWACGFLAGDGLSREEQGEAEQKGPGVITSVHGQEITVDGTTVWSEAHRSHGHHAHVDERATGLTAWTSETGPTIVTDEAERVVGVGVNESQLSGRAWEFANKVFSAQAETGVPLDSLNASHFPDGPYGSDGATAVWRIDDLSGAGRPRYVFLNESVSAQAPNLLSQATLPMPEPVFGPSNFGHSGKS